jgi:drug/metabolite transporter (DMT)-like permease
MLLAVTLLWGLSFPLVKRWLLAAERTGCPGGEGVAVLTLIGLRTFLAVLILAIFQSHLFKKPSRREYGIGLLIGFLNFLGFGLQVWGLTATSPALSAFFSSLGSAWVPLLAFLWFRQGVAPLTLLGLSAALGGSAMLARINSATGWSLGWGEQMTLASSVIFAVMILLLDRLGRRTKPGHLTFGFLIATGLPSVVLVAVVTGFGPGLRAWLVWLAIFLCDPWVLLDLALLTVLCTVLAFHWFTMYQPRVSANRAALIYLLEPVFGTAYSILWGLDVLTLYLVIGGSLVLAGNLLVELPGWLRRKRSGAF